jgi:hypothetical protein
VSKFNRDIPEAGLQMLEARPSWWQDILDYRFEDKSGLKQPLFSAIRDGYLNVYIAGQSILKIGFSNDGKSLKAEMHHKYIPDDNVYFKFDGSHFQFDRHVAYKGKESLEKMARLARGYSGAEKEGVAVIVGRHSQVIDVEMGLPANILATDTDRPVAPRMDMVALEDHGSEIAIVFYETKCFDNPELRAKNFTPRVFAQLERYVEWISSPTREAEVIAAYRRACQIHIRLYAMMDKSATTPIHPLVAKAALSDSKLIVDKAPRLIIFDYKTEQTKGGWELHEAALRDRKIPIIMMPRPEDISLMPVT